MRDRSSTLVFGVFVFLLLVLAGVWYAGDRGIPRVVVRVVLPAFLFEAGMYLLSGAEAVRNWFARIRPANAGMLLTALSPISFLLLTIPMGSFNPVHLCGVLGLALAASFWYAVLPARLPWDLGFLVVMALPVLFGIFGKLYPDPSARVPAQILGLIMWYRTGLVAVLSIRRMRGIGFGFVPRASEWAIGVRNFLFFLPIGSMFGFGIGFIRLRPVVWDSRTAVLALLTFAGVLLVLAVAEEFFFRGLLQQELSQLFRSELAGLIAASVLFGAAHLGGRQFPNWRFALLATLAGLFYGRAYLQARSIRAAMVTHALVVTTWRVFLSS